MCCIKRFTITINTFHYIKHFQTFVFSGENNLAEEDYKKALSLQPNDSSSHSQLAVALGRQFKKKEALDNFKLAIKLTEK